VSSADLESFLAGRRTDHVAFFLHEDGVGDPDALAEVGRRTDDGVTLVLPAEEGRASFERATSLDPMDFAGAAMGTEGRVDRDLTDGRCPAATGTDADGTDHHARFVFAFAEDHHPEMEGLYAEGPVVHAYAACDCGETYAEKWVAGDGDGD
jgi:hypothetical protein